MLKIPGRTDHSLVVIGDIQNPIRYQIKISTSGGCIQSRNGLASLYKKPHWRMIDPEHTAIHGKDQFFMLTPKVFLKTLYASKYMPAVILPIELNILRCGIDNKADDIVVCI